jgi:hypothetical protein
VIEPTDEMITAALNATECDPAECTECMAKVVAAVLAIVERDRAAEAAAVQGVVDAYRKSVAKGYFRSLRGPVARAVDALNRAVSRP